MTNIKYMPLKATSEVLSCGSK